MDNNEIITIVDESGEEKDVSLVFSYTDEETNREYMLFGDMTEDADAETQIYVFYRDPDSAEDELYEIESDEEYERVSEVLDALIGTEE